METAGDENIHKLNRSWLPQKNTIPPTAAGLISDGACVIPEEQAAWTTPEDVLSLWAV